MSTQVNDMLVHIFPPSTFLAGLIKQQQLKYMDAAEDCSLLRNTALQSAFFLWFPFVFMQANLRF